MKYEDTASCITIDSDYEGGSAGEVTPLGERHYEVMMQPETVAPWFLVALEEHFGGGGVPREYAASVRLTHSGREPVRATVRFRFTKNCGKGYMSPPYWLRRRGDWRPVPATNTTHERESHVDLSIELQPDETVFLANKPYRTNAEVGEELTDLVELGQCFVMRSIGRTDGGRTIPILQTSGKSDDWIVIAATPQPAEPAARPVLAFAHWLSGRSALATRMLELFNFAFIPMPNPDGAAEGRSCTNALGEIPMFSYGKLLSGEPAPLETTSIWNYLAEIQPLSYIEFHTHYQDVNSHKLNPMALEWFPKDRHDFIKRVGAELTSLNRHWRMITLDSTLPMVRDGLYANLAEKLGTLAYCYQIYAASEEATCAHAVEVVTRLASALAGDALSDQADPRIVAG